MKEYKAISGVGALILCICISILCFWLISTNYRNSDQLSADIAAFTHEHAPVSTLNLATTSIPNIDEAPPGQIADRDRLLAMFDRNDRNSVFKVVDTIQSDPKLSQNCHEIAHDLGHHAYELFGFSDAMTFDNPEHVRHALVQNICAGGYTHGILEELSLHDPSFLQHPESICGGMSGDERSSCFHGMGHVFMLANAQDAPASILGCRVIKLPTDMYRCFEGVRMEQFWGNIGATTSAALGWDPQRPLDTCMGVQTDEKPTCFLYSTFGYLRIHPKDYSGAAQLCTKSGLNDLDDHFCLKGLGMTMMSKFKGQHMESSETYAVGLSTIEKDSFYQGVMGYAHLSGLSEAALANVCNLLKNDSLVCMDALDFNKSN